MGYPLQIPAQLSSHLRALRKAKGWSQAALGQRLGLSQARIARIEGDPLSISVDQLLAVLTALGVRVTLDPVLAAAPALPGMQAQASGRAGRAPASKSKAHKQEADW